MAKTIQFAPQGGGQFRACMQLPNTNATDIEIESAGVPTRPSSTIINSDRLIENVPYGVPKFDFSADSNCPVYLNEPQKTNLLISSETFNASPWVGVGITTITPDAIRAPTVELKYGTFLQCEFTTFGSWLSYPNIFDGNANSFSIFAKTDSSSYNKIRINNDGVWYTVFDLITGNGTTVDENLVLNSTPLADGWWRLEIIDKLNRDGTLNISPDVTGGGVGVYIFGAMIEVGINVTTYIPNTTTQTFTRVMITNTAFNLQGYFNSQQGTIVFKFNNLGYTAYGRIFQITTATEVSNLPAITISLNGQNKITILYRNSINQTFVKSSQTVFNGDINLVVVYATNRLEFYVNGVFYGSNTNVNTDSWIPSRINFQNAISGNQKFYGAYKDFQYENIAISQSQAIEKSR